MTKMRQRIGILLIILLGLSPRFVWACGPYYEEETKITLLLKGIADEEIIWHYTHDEETLDSRTANIAEWRDFLRDYADETIQHYDIGYWIYDANLEMLTQLHTNLVERLSSENAKESLTASQQREVEVLAYLLFAKQCEQHVATPYNPWEGIERDIPAMQQLMEGGMQAYQQTTSEFLQLRYAYQLVRLARYMEEYAHSITLYDDLIAPLNVQSIITYWAIDQKAGALRRTGNVPEALYLFSQVFDRAPEKRESAYRSFRMSLGGQDVWQATLEYAQNDHELSVLWALWNAVNGYGQGLDMLRSLYTLDPSAPLLESLLVQEIRKIEHGQQTSSSYLADLKAFILECAHDDSVPHVGLWYLMAGYVAVIEAQYDEALGLFDQAEARFASSDTIFLHQVTLLRIMARISPRNAEITENIEQQIYHELQWLSKYDTEQIVDSVLVLLAQKYLHQDNVPKAISCLLKAGDNTFLYNDTRSFVLLDVYASQKDLTELMTLVTQPTPSSFERFLREDFPFSLDELRDIQGTRWLRTGDFQKAIDIFHTISESYWGKMPDKNSPDKRWFTTRFLDNEYHGSQEQEPEMVERVNKRIFTEKVVELQQQALDDPSQADRYYWQIGNAFYHTPFWGYSRVLWGDYYCGCDCIFFQRYDSPLSSLDYTFSQHLQEQVAEILKDCDTRHTALQYYLKVIELTQDPELAAESTVLAHSSINPNKTKTYGYGKYFEQVNDKSYLSLLKDRYANTTFYDRMIEECATFKYFVNPNAP